MIRTVVAALDIASALLSLACITLILMPVVRKTLGRELIAITAAYFALGFLYQISLMIEWTSISGALDPYEDYLQFFQPFLLVFLLYSYVRGRAALDVNEEEKRHQILFNAIADAIFFLRKDPADGYYKCIDVKPGVMLNKSIVDGPYINERYAAVWAWENMGNLTERGRLMKEICASA